MKTLVVKIGTSTLCRNGVVDRAFLDDLARQIHALRDEWRVVIVTSGAIRVGLDTIGRARAVRLPEKQAAAAIGQSLLMREYRRAFEDVAENIVEKITENAVENVVGNVTHENRAQNPDIEYSMSGETGNSVPNAAMPNAAMSDIPRSNAAMHNAPMHVAQLLLTRADLADRRRFVNARRTFAQLFKWNILPIVNENDTVATEEIRFGDNDTLAAMTALCCEAQLVILLSDIDGFYLPNNNKPESHIENITDEIEAAAGGAGSVGGTGGMRTKIEAARIATNAGIELVIAHGRASNIVIHVARDENVGTRFCAQTSSTRSRKTRSRKNWIASRQKSQGVLILNECAREHLTERGSSLLPVGIEDVQGDFQAGDVVSMRDACGEIGRGLANFSSDDLRKVIGLHSSQISLILGLEAAPEAIHRDNLTLQTASKKDTLSTRSLSAKSNGKLS